MNALFLAVFCAFPTALLAAPYPSLEKAPRLVLPISPYTEDPQNWTAERVAEALQMADKHLDVCAIDLKAGELQLTQHRQYRWGESLRRADDPLELVLILRDEDDGNRYEIAGVASFRGWRVEGPWADAAPALAQLASNGRSRYWPKPKSDKATTEAWLALMWAVGKGWATPAPSITEEHCHKMRKRIERMGKRHGGSFARQKQAKAAAARRGGKNERYRARGTWRFRRTLSFPKPPTELLLADERSRSGYRLVIKSDGAWHLSHPLLRNGVKDPIRTVPATGRGIALLALHNGALALVERSPKGHTVRWLVAGEEPSLTALPGCNGVLASDVMYPARGTDSEAVLVCSRALHVLGADRTLKTHALPAADWATITRWGPGRARLLMGGVDGLHARVLKLDESPEPLDLPKEMVEMARLRPNAPIWSPAGNATVQLGKDALHGLGKPRPLGKADTVFNGNVFSVIRSRKVGERTQLRIDDAYDGKAWSADLPKGALWASHGGDYDPYVLVLVQEDKKWVIRPPDWKALNARSRRPAPTGP